MCKLMLFSRFVLPKRIVKYQWSSNYQVLNITFWMLLFHLLSSRGPSVFGQRKLSMSRRYFRLFCVLNIDATRKGVYGLGVVGFKQDAYISLNNRITIRVRFIVRFIQTVSDSCVNPQSGGGTFSTRLVSMVQQLGAYAGLWTKKINVV